MLTFIRHLFVFLFLSIMLTACGGSSSTPPAPADPTTLSGTAAAGAAIIGTVTVKGALNNTKSAIIEANGNYNVDVTGLTAPYRLRATGTVGGRTYKLHSYAEEADLGGTVNITPFTDLIVANAAQQIAESFFDSTTTTSLDSADVDAQEDALQAKLQNVLDALGVDTAINLLNTTFSADHSGLDAALDIVRVEVDTGTQIATITNLIENTTIQDSLAVADDNTETLTVTDPDSLTAAVSDTQAIANIFDTLNTAFANGLPQSTAIQDFFHESFLQLGQSKSAFLTDITTDPSFIGLTFNRISVFNMDSAAGTANVYLSVAFNGITEIDSVEDTDGWFVVEDSTGLWHILGDQRIVETSFNFHCNDSDGNDGDNGSCGINTQFFDDDFINNGTVADAPIASGTVSIINGTDKTTVRDVIYLGTPTLTAPGDVQVYDEASGQFFGDYQGLGSDLGQIDPSIFQVGDIIEHKLYTQDLDISTIASPQIEAGAIAVKTYTDTLLSVPSLTTKYPTATAATLTAISAYTLGNDLELAWTLADGTVNEEVLVEISDSNGNRFETDIGIFGSTTSSLTFTSSTLSSTVASDAGLDQNAASYNLLVRVYAADSVTGQSHSRDYTTLIPGPGATSTTPPPVASTLTCNYESGYNDAADGGLGAPITPNSFADYEAVVTDCGTAKAFTVADVAGATIVDDTESTTFTNSAGAGTQNDPKTGTFSDSFDGFSADFEWYVEDATCSGCTHSYVVLQSNTTIEPNLPLDTLRETSALTGIIGTLGVSGSIYSLARYSEQSNFSDADRATGSDGEIWNSSTNILQ